MTTHTYPSAATAATARPATSALTALLVRLHFYIGLFVGPFILVAAVTGTLFVLTPQIETHLYADQLFNQSKGPAQPLGAQVTAAQNYLWKDGVAGDGIKAPRLFAVRPSKGEGWNTRVQFTQKGMQDSESRAIFIDPVTLAVKGDLMVYGTSGTLPFRSTLDYLHRNLMLGDLGRNYSELAASWLWLGSLGGLYLWWNARRRSRQLAQQPVKKPLNARRLHSLIGLWIVVGLVFFSATGLTWSRWAGGHVDLFRNYVGWITPSASMKLHPTGHEQPMGEHAEHAGHGAHNPHAGMAMPMPVAGDPARFDVVESIARKGGIDASEIEIRPARSSDQAWMVREVDRTWPTQVDTVAVDPDRMAITSRADFANFPLIAKLIRWGVDAHMGILFGVANQILMAAFGIALTAMIVLGYVMWWRRRPAAGAGLQPLSQAFMQLAPAQRVVVGVLAVILGWSLPLMGISLLMFLVVDVLRWQRQR